MWRTWLAALVIAVLAPRTPAGPEVHGTVSTPEGAAYEGAQIVLMPFPTAHHTALAMLGLQPAPAAAAATATDAAGRFRLELPRPGPWRLVVAADGFVPMHYFPLVFTTSTELHPLTLVRDRGAGLRVLDAAGRPLAGVALWAAGRLGGAGLGRGGWRRDLRFGRTDAAGRAALARAGDELLEISVVAGPRTVARRGDVAGGELRTPEPGDLTRLEIVDRDGVGVAGVVARPPDGVAPWAASGPDGLLAVPGRPAEIRLSTADGWRHAARPAPSGERLRVVHAGARRVGGRVVDAHRRPLAGALVWSRSDPGIHARTDSRGRYRLTAGEDPGAWLQAEAEGHLPRAFALTAAHLSSGRAPTVGLRPAVSFAARVTSLDGEPLAGVLAELAGARDGRPRGFYRPDPLDGRARSAAAGDFRIEGLEDDLPYDLRLSLPGFVTRTVRLEPLGTSPPQTLPSFPLAPSRGAFGQVADVDGRPIAGARILLSPTGTPIPAREAFDPEDPSQGRSNSDGSFEIAAIPAAEIQLTTYGEGYAPATVRGIEVPASASAAPADLGTVVLVPGETLAGRVVDGGGESLVEAAIHVLRNVDPRRLDSLAGQRLAGREPDAVSGADGAFRLDELVAGEPVHLFVHRRDRVPRWIKGVRVPAAEPLTVVLEAGFTVAGRIVDAAGEPVAEADLSLAQDLSPPERRLLRSDPLGHFAFEGLRPGAATLDVFHPAFVAPDSVELEVGAADDELTVVLERGAVLAGRVTTASGDPVERARVTAGSAAAFSDADGVYRAEGMALGPATVEAQHFHYGRTLAEIDVEAGENPLDLTFPDGYTVAGRVVDEDRRGVAGAEISLIFDAGRGLRKYRALAQEDGAFRLAPVADGDYRLAVRKEGYAFAGEDPILSVAGTSIEDLELLLGRGVDAAGAILGLGFDELARVRVRAERRGGASITGRVDFEGRYRIRDLAPGGWLLRADLDGGRRQTQARIVIEPGQDDLDRDLRFEERLTLSGTVLLEGEPLADARLSLEGLDLAVARSATTGHQGDFRFEDLDAGRYRFGLAHGPSRLVYNRDVDLDGDRDLVLDLRQVRVGGRVVEAGGGPPVPEALVALRRLGENGTVTNVLSTGSGADGAFDFRRVPEGRYRLSVHKDGYSSEPRPLEVASGDQIHDLELEVAATRGLDLAVRWATGGSPAAVTVLVFAGDAAGRPILQESRAVDAGGRVRLPTVPAGRWRLVVAAQGAVPAELPAEAPGPAVDVELAAAGAFDVRVPALYTSDRVARLRLVGPGRRLLQGVDPADGLVDSWPLIAGRGKVQGVPPGPWEVRVTAGDGQIWSAAVVAEPHREVVVPLP